MEVMLDDLWVYSLGFCERADVARFAQTCKSAYKLTKNQLLWKKMYDRDFSKDALGRKQPPAKCVVWKSPSEEKVGERACVFCGEDPCLGTEYYLRLHMGMRLLDKPRCFAHLDCLSAYMSDEEAKQRRRQEEDGGVGGVGDGDAPEEPIIRCPGATCDQEPLEKLPTFRPSSADILAESRYDLLYRERVSGVPSRIRYAAFNNVKNHMGGSLFGLLLFGFWGVLPLWSTRMTSFYLWTAFALICLSGLLLFWTDAARAGIFKETDAQIVPSVSERMASNLQRFKYFVLVSLGVLMAVIVGLYIYNVLFCEHCGVAEYVVGVCVIVGPAVSIPLMSHGIGGAWAGWLLFATTFVIPAAKLFLLWILGWFVEVRVP